MPHYGDLNLSRSDKRELLREDRKKFGLPPLPLDQEEEYLDNWTWEEYVIPEFKPRRANMWIDFKPMDHGKCNYCGKENTDLCLTPGDGEGMWVCEDCYNNEFAPCEICGNYIPSDELQEAPDGRSVCLWCLEELESEDEDEEDEEE